MCIAFLESTYRAVTNLGGWDRDVLFGLVLMITGGLAMAFAPTWGCQVAGRAVAGIGGVLLNVLMSNTRKVWSSQRQLVALFCLANTSSP